MNTIEVAPGCNISIVKEKTEDGYDMYSLTMSLENEVGDNWQGHSSSKICVKLDEDTLNELSALIKDAK
jgi:hypothetical protein